MLASTTAISSTKTSNSISDATKSLNLTSGQFIKLLTVQLQNQDPTAPMDTNQITQQVASLSQVQQGIDTNTNLQKLIALYTQSQNTTNVDYIGKLIEAQGNFATLSGNRATFTYSLAADASNVTVSVLDAKGKVVTQVSGAGAAGQSQWVWNGKDAQGNPATGGPYTVSVKAQDAAGNDIVATSNGTFDKVAGSQGTLSGGSALFTYNLDSAAAATNITVTDMAGKLIYKGPGTKLAGHNQWLWKGQNNAGETVPDGTYTFAVSAKDANGAAITATPYTSGIVTSVETQNGSNYLAIGDILVPMDKVTSVKGVPSAASGA